MTVGHLWMIKQGVSLFDRLVVAVGINPEKRYTFPLEERLMMLQESLKQFLADHGDHLYAMAARSRVSEAAALTDPAGLGAHHVFVFARGVRT